MDNLVPKSPCSQGVICTVSCLPLARTTWPRWLTALPLCSSGVFSKLLIGKAHQTALENSGINDNFRRPDAELCYNIARDHRGVMITSSTTSRRLPCSVLSEPTFGPASSLYFKLVHLYNWNYITVFSSEQILPVT